MNDTKLYRKYNTKVAEMTKPENFPTHSAMYYYLHHKQFPNSHKQSGRAYITLSRSITLYNIAYPLRATTFFTKSITTGDG